MIWNSRSSIFCAIFLLTLSNNIHSMQESGASSAHEPDPNSICAICQDSLNGQVPALRLRCGHAFHQSCILNWINENQTCPTCRQSVATTAADAAIPAYLPSQPVAAPEPIAAADAGAHLPPQPVAVQEPAANQEPITHMHRIIESLQHRWQALQTPRIRSVVITGLELATLATMSRIGRSALKNSQTRLIYGSTLVPAAAAPFIPETIAPRTVTTSTAIAWAARHLLYPHTTMSQARISAAGLATGFLAPTLAQDCYQRIHELLPTVVDVSNVSPLARKALALFAQIAVIGVIDGLSRLLI